MFWRRFLEYVVFASLLPAVYEYFGTKTTIIIAVIYILIKFYMYRKNLPRCEKCKIVMKVSKIEVASSFDETDKVEFICSKCSTKHIEQE